MRAKITSDHNGVVTLSYDNWVDGSRIVRKFSVAENGGYIRELIGSEWKQVCERLEPVGETLWVSNVSGLADEIRAEYRRMRVVKSGMFV